MPVYSLIEYKLRRYLYLGHEYCIYVPPSIRPSLWDKKHHDDVTGVRIIGKIVKRNRTEEINSIVPILLKIKKEGKLLDDRLLIFALAVCAKFNLKQCAKMVTDAYAAVMIICTDGLKLLMFVKFCTTASSILNDQDLLTDKCNGFGRGFSKAMTKWYLNRDPLLTTEHIVRNKSYDGWSHKDVMKLIHLQSQEPCRIMYIVYTLNGIDKVEQLFGIEMKDVCIENVHETFENKQLKFIYNFLNQVEAVKTMDERALKCEIELKRWGNEPEIIPQQMLKSSTILTSLIMHLPLKTILDNTFYYAKHRVFSNLTPDVGLWEYISRFNNTVLLRKSQIHPIEPFIQYVKYSRTSKRILDLQNNILKKKETAIVDAIDKKLKVIMDLQKTSDKTKVVIQPTVENKAELSNEESQTHNLNDQKCNVASSFKSTENQKSDVDLKKSKHKSTKGEKTKSKQGENSLIKLSIEEEVNIQIANSSHRISTLNINSQPINPESTVKNVIQSEANDVDQNQDSVIIVIRQFPKLVDKMLTFLSEDLIKKTCDILTPSGLRIMIAYDSRECMKKSMCECTRLLSVHEAITLITLSLIYPEKLENKPTIYGLNSTVTTCKEIKIDYTQPLTVAYLESILFKKSGDSISVESVNKSIPEVYPQFAFDWALEKNKEFDLFVFMGTNRMNLKKIKMSLKKYQEVKKPVKVVICCLNGKHYEQINLGRGNMLIIIGFDKNVGKLINSFIKEEF